MNTKKDTYSILMSAIAPVYAGFLQQNKYPDQICKISFQKVRDDLEGTESVVEYKFLITLSNNNLCKMPVVDIEGYIKEKGAEHLNSIYRLDENLEIIYSVGIITQDGEYVLYSNKNKIDKELNDMILAIITYIYCTVISVKYTERLIDYLWKKYGPKTNIDWIRKK